MTEQIRTWHDPETRKLLDHEPRVRPKGGTPGARGPGQRPEKSTAASDPHWLSRHIGKPVCCRLLDGTELSGDLIRIYQYDLLLRCHEEEVLLLKHALTQVRAGSTIKEPS